MPPLPTGTKIMDFDSSWIKGSNNSMDPSALPLGYAWSTLNMINVSGVLSCRPGHRCIAELPAGKLQGMAVFRPNSGLEQIMVAVDGVIYVASYPFKVFRFLPNVLFSASARQIFWEQATQSADLITPGSLTSARQVLAPKEVMFMQDGGNTAPAYYDGSNSGHIRDLPYQTPAGGPMAWVGDRLWVAVGADVYASNIADPFNFTEQIYLGGSQSFNFSREVTAMERTPSIQFPQLVVFTEESMSIIQANIRERDKWTETEGMQREILQIGCSSSRAVASQFGRVTWFSSSGLVWYDPATSTAWTSRSPLRDTEQMESKSGLFSDLSGVAVGIFGQWFLASVPYEDIFNEHTWVMNNNSWETISDQGGPTWSGVWTGTRPVEWAYGVIAGTERIFHVSRDKDDVNRLWESFTTDRLDNECPITWALFTRGYFGLTGQSQKLPGLPCRFGYADIALTAIDEDLDLGAFVAAGTRGAFRKIASTKFNVARGSMQPDSEITLDTTLVQLKAQSRIFRTQDADKLEPNDAVGSCPAETPAVDNLDESHQLLVVGHGPATIKWIRPFAWIDMDDDTGNDKACEPEEDFRGVRFDGIGLTDSDDIEALMLALAEYPITKYTGVATETLRSGEYVGVGSGTSSSIVSQAAADRVAQIIATKQAEKELAAQVPPIYSNGVG